MQLSERTNQLKELASYAYRELQSGKWAKPVGKSMLVYDLDSCVWSCRFVDMNGELGIWTRQTYTPGEHASLSAFLRHCECFHGRYDVPAVTEGRSLGFLTPREECEFFLA